jgi:hypothetical protein
VCCAEAEQDDKPLICCSCEGSLLVFGRFGSAAALECLRQWENVILCAETCRVGHGVGACGRRHRDD